MRKKLLVVFATGLSLLFGAGVAMANPHVTTKGDRLYTGTFASDCYKCHENSAKHTTGPHGGYTATTAKCNTCHDVHIGENSEKGDPMGLAGQYNEQLLPGQSLTAACNYCHDLTGSKDGPYNLTGGINPQSAHRVIDLNGRGAWPSYTDTQGHVNDNS
ncbi:MAG TPA: hypothetical protein VHS59_03525, partial [Bacillota bacterium]|nr:hypothetical protein [Bacillota bacterium]